MIKLTTTGDWSKTIKYLTKAQKIEANSILQEYGKRGVEALRSVTPVDTGVTASSWRYEIVRRGGGFALEFHNDNINNHVNIAIILQYGHGTGTGGWVEGRDYINPVIQPLFDELADKLWKEVNG